MLIETIEIYYQGGEVLLSSWCIIISLENSKSDLFSIEYNAYFPLLYKEVKTSKVFHLFIANLNQYFSSL